MLVNLTTGVGVTFLVAAFLLWITYKKRKIGSYANRWHWIRPVLGFIAGSAVTGVFFGVWGMNAMSWLFGIFGSPSRVAAIVLFVLLVIFLCDIWDGKADKFAMWASFLIPIVALSASGFFGGIVKDIRSTVLEQSNNVTQNVTGG